MITGTKFNDLPLIKGAAYIVKHENNKQSVRRIFKAIEMRFDSIPCYAFTGKVRSKVSVRIEPTNNPDVIFWHWRGVKHPPNEISIPYYNIKSITPIN